ncbi:NACHT domain-containing protein [Micromonospora sp. NPDC051227]|uniref:NACHT domain-containing protein n=1 Tax=Micromonospora sp. NPDC051227 TaxID=3364285 RepID=UPI0037B81859
MAAKKLAFVDAVRLLGGETDEVGWLSRLAGVTAGAVTVATVGGVDLFALRDELKTWGNAVVGRIQERAHGLSRFDRTQRLVAAHSVIVVTSFFEALDQVLSELPELDPARAKLTGDEQVALATKTPAAQKYAEMVTALIDQPPPMPAPHLPFESTLTALEQHYRTVTGRVHAFLTGLRAYDRAPLHEAARLMRQQLPGVARDRYLEAYRMLAVQAPEFRVWSGMVEAQATRAALAEGVAVLRAELSALREAGNVAVDSVLAGLGARHRARLARSVFSSSDAPAHVTFPSLERAYVKPRGLVSVAGPTDLPATETWWRDKPAVADVPDFLLGHLTGHGAIEQPAVILGQPGAGKSVLTEVLAAELPEREFLVVRVELRNVHADSSVQQQIERALYQALGEAVSWPELVRRSGSALPVVIMDGFDELLQATGVNRADYLEQLQEFQLREADLQRPVAVLVTSRTVVADRARFPPGTVVVRLEPFDDAQLTAWLAMWNAVNSAGLQQRGLDVLTAENVVQYGELARQPLLLLLLVLYDAGANALQAADRGIGRLDLYERLFADFVAREVDKHDVGLSPEQRGVEIEREWRRLCAVALAMLNRGSDVISEAELEADIVHLLDPEDLGPARPESLRKALSVGQLLVGRFFFIHESQVSRGVEAVERSFEFLHATFGEFLAARQIVHALTELAEDRSRQRRRPGVSLDAGFLYAATSFITVARRAPLWEFSRGLLERLGPDSRHRCRELVLELLVESGYSHPRWSLAGYEPRRKPVAARHATYSANLVCFAVVLADDPVDAMELVGDPVAVRWRAQALLWQSQLDPEDRKRLWQTLRVEWDLATNPTKLMVRTEDGAPVGVFQSLPWPADDRPDPTLMSSVENVGLDSDSQMGRALRRSAFVQTTIDVREHLYPLLPYWRHCGDTSLSIQHHTLQSAAGGLFELLLNPMKSRDETIDRERLYEVALSHPSPRHRQLALAQMARDAVYLHEDTLARLLSPLSIDHPDERAMANVAAQMNQIAGDAHSPQEIAVALLMHVERMDPLPVLAAFLGIGSLPELQPSAVDVAAQLESNHHALPTE